MKTLIPLLLILTLFTSCSNLSSSMPVQDRAIASTDSTLDSELETLLSARVELNSDLNANRSSKTEQKRHQLAISNLELAIINLCGDLKPVKCQKKIESALSRVGASEEEKSWVFKSISR